MVFQTNFILCKEIHIYKTYLNEDNSKFFYFKEIGKIRKIKNNQDEY